MKKIELQESGLRGSVVKAARKRAVVLVQKGKPVLALVPIPRNADPERLVIARAEGPSRGGRAKPKAATNGATAKELAARMGAGLKNAQLSLAEAWKKLSKLGMAVEEGPVSKKAGVRGKTKRKASRKTSAR
jgi:hypothetical protein